MDPRIWARRTAVRREQGRRRFRVLVIGLVGIAVLVGAWFVIHTPLFSARSITVDGQRARDGGPGGRPGGPGRSPAAARRERRRGGGTHRAAAVGAPRPVHVSWPDGVHIAITKRCRASWPVRRGPLGGAQQRRPRPSASTARPPGLLLLSGARRRPVSRAQCSRSRTPPGSRWPRRCRLPSSRRSPASPSSRRGGCSSPCRRRSSSTSGRTAELSAKYEDVSSILAGATLHNGDVIDVSVPDAPTVTAG